MISSWVGYSRAMLNWPHTDTKAGVFRFTLDIATLFCYFVLITFTQSQYSFEDHFLDFIIVIFAIFLVWDLLKTKEYWKFLDPNNTKKRTSISRYAMMRSVGKTFLYLVLFAVIRFMYHLLNEYESELFLDSEMIYALTLVLSIFFVLYYRYWKWRVFIYPSRSEAN